MRISMKLYIRLWISGAPLFLNVTSQRWNVCLIYGMNTVKSSKGKGFMESFALLHCTCCFVSPLVTERHSYRMIDSWGFVRPQSSQAWLFIQSKPRNLRKNFTANNHWSFTNCALCVLSSLGMWPERASSHGHQHHDDDISLLHS